MNHFPIAVEFSDELLNVVIVIIVLLLGAVAKLAEYLRRVRQESAGRPPASREAPPAPARGGGASARPDRSVADGRARPQQAGPVRVQPGPRRATARLEARVPAAPTEQPPAPALEAQLRQQLEAVNQEIRQARRKLAQLDRQRRDLQGRLPEQPLPGPAAPPSALAGAEQAAPSLELTTLAQLRQAVLAYEVLSPPMALRPAGRPWAVLAADSGGRG